MIENTPGSEFSPSKKNTKGKGKSVSKKVDDFIDAELGSTQVQPKQYSTSDVQEFSKFANRVNAERSALYDAAVKATIQQIDTTETARRRSAAGLPPVQMTQQEVSAIGPTGVTASNLAETEEAKARAEWEAERDRLAALGQTIAPYVSPSLSAEKLAVTSAEEMSTPFALNTSEFSGLRKLSSDYQNNTFLVENFPTVKQAQIDAGLSDQEIRDTTNFTVALNAAGMIAASQTDVRRQSLLASMTAPQQALVMDIFKQLNKDWEEAKKNNDEDGKSQVASILNLAGTAVGWIDKTFLWLNEQSQHIVRAATQLPDPRVSTFADAWNMTEKNQYDEAGIKWAREKYGSKPVDLILEFRTAQRSEDENMIGTLLDKYKDDKEASSILDQLLNGWNYNQEILDLASYIDTLDRGDLGNILLWGVLKKGNLVGYEGTDPQQDYFNAANNVLFTVGRNLLSTAGTVALDPTIALGKVRGAYMVSRYGLGKIAVENGLSARTNIDRLFKAGAVNRYFSRLGSSLEEISKAPIEKQSEMMNSLAAQEKKYFDDQALITMMKAGTFKADDFARFFEGGSNVELILRGQAARRSNQVVIPHAMRHTILAKEISYRARGLTWAKNGAEIVDAILGAGTTTKLNSTIDAIIQDELRVAPTMENRALYAKRRAEIWNEVNNKLFKAFENDPDARRKAEFVSQFSWQNGEVQKTFIRNVIEGNYKWTPWNFDGRSGAFLSAMDAKASTRAGAIISRYGYKKKGGMRARAERLSRTMSHLPNNSEPYSFYDEPGLKSSAKRMRDILLYAGVDRFWANFIRTAWLHGAPAQRRNIAEGVIKTFTYASGIHVLDPENADDFVRGLVGALDNTQVFAANVFDEKALTNLAERMAENERYTPGRGGPNMSDVASSGKNGYKEKYGITGTTDEADYTKVTVDKEYADKIAKAYDELPAYDPAAKPYYDALIQETEQQYKYMTEDLGIKVEFVTEDPYKNSAEMMRDVVNNGRLKVYKTSVDQGHPYFSAEQNDMFRAVHDFFGHAGTGMQFGQIGEEAAWIAHSSMFSPKAQRALTTETRGQNSWVNQSAHQSMRPQDRPFAEQKFAILPEEFSVVPTFTGGPERSTIEIALDLRSQIHRGIYTSPELQNELSSILKNPSKYVDAADGKTKSTAIFLGQTSKYVNMPDFTRLSEFGMRSSALQMLLGNNAGVQRLTDYWVAGTLLGPRFQLRSGIEDALMYGLTGGSFRGYMLGRKFDRSLREARGQKRSVFQTVFQTAFGLSLDKDLVLAARKAEAAKDYTKTKRLTQMAMYRFRLRLSPFKRDKMLGDPTNPYNLSEKGLRQQGYLDDLTVYGGDDAMSAIGQVQETGTNLVNALDPGTVSQGLDIQYRLHPHSETINGAISSAKGQRKGYEGQRVGRYESMPFVDGTEGYEDWFQNLFFIGATDGPKGRSAIVKIAEYDAALRSGNQNEVSRIVSELSDIITASDNEYKYTKYLVHGEREGADGLARRTLDATLPVFRTVDGRFNEKLYNAVVKTNDKGKKFVDLESVGIEELRKIGQNGNVPDFVYGRKGQVIFSPRSAAGVNAAWNATGRSLGRLTRVPMFVSNYIDARELIAPFETQMAKQFGEKAAKTWATRIGVERAYESTMVWVDNPNIRSQLAWNLRNVARFYRASEDFNRRMLRFVKNQPMGVWKAALAWNILDDSGFVDRDSNGDKYIVWPMLSPTFGAMNWLTSKLFKTPMAGIDSSVGFSSKVTMFTPSADPNAWFPTFSGPYAALLMKPIMRGLPLLSSMEDEFYGPYSEGQDLWRGVLPPTAQRIIDLAFADIAGHGTSLEQKFDSQSDSMFATAARQAMQIYYNTLDFDPTEGFKMRESENDARAAIDRIGLDLLLFKIITGNLLPASTNSFVNNTTDFAKDTGNQTLNNVFVDLIKKYDGDREKALITWYKMNPELSIWTLSTSTTTKDVGYWQAGPESVAFVEKYKDYIGKDAKRNLTFGFSMFVPESQTYGTRAQNKYLESMGLKPNKSVEDSFDELWTAQGYSNYISLMAEADKIEVEQGKDAADAFRTEAKRQLNREYPDLDTRLGGVGTSVTDAEQGLNAIREAGRILLNDPQYKAQAELFIDTVDTYYNLKSSIESSVNASDEASRIRKGWNVAVKVEAANNPDNKKYLELLDLVSTALGSDERVGR